MCGPGLPAPPPKDRAEYDALLDSMVQKTDICPYAVIDHADNKAKGHMWMMEIRPAQGVFEVGWITYSPSLQRTRPATEAVYLVGDYGFVARLPALRVEVQQSATSRPSARRCASASSTRACSASTWW